MSWNQSGLCRPNVFYTGDLASRDVGQEADGGLEVGKFTVNFPPGHQSGALERPFTIISIELGKEDPNRDVVITQLSSSGNDFGRWVQEIKGTGRQQAFVFVHGYHTTFEAAARQAGQLAFDLGIDIDFDGVPILYSWPSAGSYEGYFADYDASLESVDAFNRFLDLVKGTGLSKVHVIAHSMGNWLVANALRDRQPKADADPLVDELVLAAPDVPAYSFRNKFLPLLARLAKRITLYVSDHDKALQASAKFRVGIPRAGLLAGGLTSVKEQRFDVVDATALPADFFDHSYYASNDSMLSDIHCLLLGNPAAGRPLIVSNGSNWSFKPREALALVEKTACAAAQGIVKIASGGPTVPGITSTGKPLATGWRWWWVAGVVPLLAAIVAFARRRRRGERRGTAVTG